MTDQGRDEKGRDPTWAAFAARHPDSAFLGGDPLYALSEPIIDAIKRNAPGFFSEGQERFERDLARTASFGFFLQRPLGRAAEPTHEAQGGPSLEQQHMQTRRAMDGMMTEELCRAGVSQPDVREYFEGRAAQAERVDERQAAYAGWLLASPEFHREAREFRGRWEGAVRAAGRFPTLPIWLFPDATCDAELPGDFRVECEAFYCRWELETMLTWEWPVPMEPDFVGGMRRGVEGLSGAGITLFVPWYLLRGEKVNLQDVARLSRVGGVPEHLAGWANKRTPQGADDLGDLRYQNLSWLYRFYELVLMRRYRGVCKGNVERLDLALASVLGRDQDSVKKLRLLLRRALGADPLNG